MKKYFLLLLLLLLPFQVVAKSIETDFNEDTCVLTVSGENTGHEATISLFDEDGKLIGFKTGELVNEKYSIEFVLSYDEEKEISATLSNELGGNETSKDHIVIPSCVAPVANTDKVDEIFDEEGNSLMITDKQLGFKDTDYLELSVMDEEEIEDLLESLEGSEYYDTMKAMVDSLFADIGDYRQFGGVLDIYIHDEDDFIVDSYDDYEGGFILNILLPKEQYQLLNGIRFAPITDENTLGEELDVSYDEENEVLSVILPRLETYIMYLDNQYLFLENTDNPILDFDTIQDIILKINADFDKFINVFVDGNLLDESNYTAEEGSTIITIKKEYLKTLSKGAHEIVVNFNDGSAITTLTVNQSSVNPDTRDSIYFWIGLLAVSSLGLTFGIKRMRKAR